jgi:L-ascorbate metabolism protein UlaG (beta-lactamase superfamily)
MKITWLSQGSFLFESNGTRILVDPYMSDYLEVKGLKRMVEFPLSFEELKPDMLICTHDHLDHLDPETVGKIAEMYPKCIIAGPESCCNHFRKLQIPEKNIMQLDWEKTFVFNEIKITPVFAVHTAPHAIGLVIEADEQKIYLSGDSEYDEKLVNAFTVGCDLILICINGRLGNMSLEEALKVVKVAKPKTALAMHYGLFAENTADPEPFIRECKNLGIKSFEMTLGKEFQLI